MVSGIFRAVHISTSPSDCPSDQNHLTRTSFRTLARVSVSALLLAAVIAPQARAQTAEYSISLTGPDDQIVEAGDTLNLIYTITHTGNARTRISDLLLSDADAVGTEAGPWGSSFFLAQGFESPLGSNIFLDGIYELPELDPGKSIRYRARVRVPTAAKAGDDFRLTLRVATRAGAVQHLFTAMVPSYDFELRKGSGRASFRSRATLAARWEVRNLSRTPDTFDLTAFNMGPHNVRNLQLFKDADGDLLPDDDTVISDTGELAGGETFGFIATGTVPPAPPASVMQVRVRATSRGQPNLVENDTFRLAVAPTPGLTFSRQGPPTIRTLPGETAKFTLRLSNTGNIADTYTFTAVDVGRRTSLNPDGDDADFERIEIQVGDQARSQIRLGANTRRDVVVHATLPSSIAYRRVLKLQVTATSALDPAHSVSHTLTVSVDAVRGFTLTGLSDQTTGRYTAFVFNLRNTSLGADTFQLSAENLEGDAGDIENIQFFEDYDRNFQPDRPDRPLRRDRADLWAGDLSGYVVRGRIPDSARPGAQFRVRLTVTSVSDTTKSETQDVTITTPDIRSVALSSPPDRISRSEERLSFAYQLTNTGNVANTYSLALADLPGDDSDAEQLKLVIDTDGDGQRDGDARLTSTGEVAPGGTFHFVAVIWVPASAQGGDDLTLRVTAQGAGGAQANDDFTVTVTPRREVSLSDAPDRDTARAVTSIAYVLTNEGNATDSFTLNAADVVGGDNGDFESLAIFPDADQDGVADNGTAITRTGPVAEGANFGFVVVGHIPKTNLRHSYSQREPEYVALQWGHRFSLSVTATSESDPEAEGASENDTVTATVIAAEMAITSDAAQVDCDTGAVLSARHTTAIRIDPGACIEYRLQAQNIGDRPAQNVRLTLPIPEDTRRDSRFQQHFRSWSLTDGSLASSGKTVAPVTTHQVPPVGQHGSFDLSLGSLRPGQTRLLTFSVTIDERMPPRRFFTRWRVTWTNLRGETLRELAVAAHNIAGIYISAFTGLLLHARDLEADPGEKIAFRYRLTNSRNTGVGALLSVAQAGGDSGDLVGVELVLPDFDKNGMPDTPQEVSRRYFIRDDGFDFEVTATVPQSAQPGDSFAVTVTGTINETLRVVGEPNAYSHTATVVYPVRHAPKLSNPPGGNGLAGRDGIVSLYGEQQRQRPGYLCVVRGERGVRRQRGSGKRGDLRRCRPGRRARFRDGGQQHRRVGGERSVSFRCHRHGAGECATRRPTGSANHGDE